MNLLSMGAGAGTSFQSIAWGRAAGRAGAFGPPISSEAPRAGAAAAHSGPVCAALRVSALAYARPATRVCAVVRAHETNNVAANETNHTVGNVTAAP